MKIRLPLYCVSLLLAYAAQSMAQDISGNSYDDFFKPITFTKLGVDTFFTSVFNTSEYAQDILPYNLDHFSEFLSIAHTTPNPGNYVGELSKLWNEKYKEVLFIHVDTVITFLETLSSLSVHYPELYACESRAYSIKRCLYDALLHKFNLLKHHPEKFLDDLTQEIIASQDGNRSLVLFLESIMNKVLWADEDKNRVFETFTHLDTLIYQLYAERHIIDEEALYRLSNSLICRLKYLMDIAGDELDFSFYEQMVKSIDQRLFHFVDLEEAEDAIISRGDFLKNILMKQQLLIAEKEIARAANVYSH